MKTLRLLILMLIVTVSAGAQNSRITISYDASKLRDTENNSAINLMGTTIGYSTPFSISSKSDLALELGAKLSYGFYGLALSSYDSSNALITNKKTMTVVSISLPVNISYTLNLNDRISLTPYAGLSLKANVIALATEDYTNSSDSDENYSLTANLMSDYDTENNWNIGQVGAQVGLGINFSRIYVGVCYYQDLTQVASGYEFSTFSINAGFNF